MGALSLQTVQRARGEGRSVFHVGLVLLYVLSFAAVAYVLSRGLPFYLTPAGERAHQEGYWTWKPGGSAGRLLGVVGATLMTLMLAYTVRKRVKWLRGLGPLARWLDVHIYMGIVGPLLVVLHSGFRVQGLVALSFWSMVAVALSGVFGRYLYLQIPRTRTGEELSLTEIERMDHGLSTRLRSEFGLSEPQVRRVERLCAPADRGWGFWHLAADGRRRRRGLRDLARECRHVPAGLWRQFEDALRQKARLHRRLHLLDRMQKLFHQWHVVHKPFAIVMYLFMLLHIGVAVATGYGWNGLWAWAH